MSRITQSPESNAETVEVKARSGRVLVLRELNGLEQTHADRVAGDPMAMLSYRVAMALTAIDGKVLPPAKSDLELKNRLQSIKASELDAIIKGYNTAFGELTDNELGNGSEAGDSAQS